VTLVMQSMLYRSHGTHRFPLVHMHHRNHSTTRTILPNNINVNVEITAEIHTLV